MGLDLEAVRLEIEKQVGTGPDVKLPAAIPYTPRVKRVLALAAREAKALNHTYVGTEHILLGLLREGDGVAARVLKSLKVDIEQTRHEILITLDPNFPHAPRDAAKPQVAEVPKPSPDSVDLSKRYDIYCVEQNQQVVYRNALFKGTKKLFLKNHFGPFSEFVELEQSDGKTVFIAAPCIIKFCEHGVTPTSERVASEGAA
jgi:ATP-dependent Clp protease ATP-binding subunit ClpA